MDYQIKIEDGDVKVYSPDGGLCSHLGTLRPNDEQICRVIHRAIELGRQDKANEIRDVIGAR